MTPARFADYLANERKELATVIPRRGDPGGLKRGGSRPLSWSR